MHGHTLDYQDGWLCVKYSHTMTSEPLKITLWWPIAKTHPDMYADYIGCNLYDLGQGIFELPGKGNSAYGTLRLPDGGSTQAFKMQEDRVQPPKVRKGTDLRWRDGRWEKYSKANGWIAA